MDDLKFGVPAFYCMNRKEIKFVKEKILGKFKDFQALLSLICYVILNMKTSLMSVGILRENREPVVG